MTALQKWDEPRPVRLTVRDFLRLDEAGAFEAYAKTELIEGVIVAMNAQFSMHARVKSRLFRRLAEAVDRAMPGYEVWAEVSVAIAPENLPEPDLVVTNFSSDERVPVPSETVSLIVEIADTTAAFDLGPKARIYAAAGIAEYWVVDLAGAIRQHWEPQPDGYAQQRTITLGDRIEAATVAGLAVATAGL